MHEILQVATPRNLKQVRSFVGMLNHYKAMNPHRSHLLTPLTALTKKNVKFEWTKEHQQAFDSLKNSLAREVVLASLLKTTSHWHSIQENSPILKRDTL
jgi:hypothetical protein